MRTEDFNSIPTEALWGKEEVKNLKVLFPRIIEGIAKYDPSQAVIESAIQAPDPDNPDMYRGMMVGFALVETLIDGYITSHSHGIAKEERGVAFMSKDRATAEHKALVPSSKEYEADVMMARLHNIATRLGYKNHKRIDGLKEKLMHGVVVGIKGINFKSFEDRGDLYMDRESVSFLLGRGMPDWEVKNVHIARLTPHSHNMINGLIGTNLLSIYQQIHTAPRRQR